MSALWRRLRRSVSARIVVAVLLATGLLISDTTVAVADGDVIFEGRGFGHGRGMSQWGSYGYAVELGASYQWILDHYYGGTSLAGDAGNPEIDVELLGLRSKETLLTGPDLVLNGVPVGRAAVRLRGVAANTIEVTVADSCAGPWTLWNGTPTSLVGSYSTVTGEVRLCEAGGIRAYRGSMVVLDGGGYQATVNRVRVDDYLRGVVPKESLASWGSAGGGSGMEALKVQAVAARSYALAGRYNSYANTCDTTACQVYAGGYTRADGGVAKWIEDSRTDAAVAATTGQVRRKSDGTIARTEFSASSGGWTAGGDFPAVEDQGDLTAANPNNAWTATFTRARVAAALRIPAISRVQVTGRTGLGPDGGRVLQVTFDTTGGQRTFTGNQVRSAMGLKSDWFSIKSTTTAQARAFAQALYADILGRPGDAGGIDYWAAKMVQGDDPQGIAYGFANSAERYRQMINTAYVLGLHRTPDPGGAQNWLAFLLRGGTLNDLNSGIYGSQESLVVLGAGDTGAWVDAVYQSLLGRSAGADERAQWTALTAQVGRSGVALWISQSAEARRRRLGDYYIYLLGRGMDEGGWNTFGPSLSNRGDVDAVAIIAASAEYRARAESRFP